MINWSLDKFLLLSNDAKLLYVYMIDHGLRVDKSICIDQVCIEALIGAGWMASLQELRRYSLIKVKQIESNYKVVGLIDDATGLSILLKDGSFFEVDNEFINELRECYPDADVIAVIKRCVRWNADQKNAHKRKTRGGIKRHVHAFFAEKNKKAIDKAKDDLVPTVGNGCSLIDPVSSIKEMLKLKKSKLRVEYEPGVNAI